MKSKIIDSYIKKSRYCWLQESCGEIYENYVSHPADIIKTSGKYCIDEYNILLKLVPIETLCTFNIVARGISDILYQDKNILILAKNERDYIILYKEMEFKYEGKFSVDTKNIDQISYSFEKIIRCEVNKSTLIYKTKNGDLYFESFDMLSGSIHSKNRGNILGQGFKYFNLGKKLLIAILHVTHNDTIHTYIYKISDLANNRPNPIANWRDNKFTLNNNFVFFFDDNDNHDDYICAKFVGLPRDVNINFQFVLVQRNDLGALAHFLVSDSHGTFVLENNLDSKKNHTFQFIKLCDVVASKIVRYKNYYVLHSNNSIHTYKISNTNNCVEKIEIINAINT
jgi:hypothetical protein